MEQSPVLVQFAHCLFPHSSPLRPSTHLFASRDLDIKQYLLHRPSQKTKHVNQFEASTYVYELSRPIEDCSVTHLQYLKPCSLVHVYGRFR